MGLTEGEFRVKMCVKNRAKLPVLKPWIVRSQLIYARFMVAVNVTSGFGEFVVV
jgi:hypothetical protein